MTTSGDRLLRAQAHTDRFRVAGLTLASLIGTGTGLLLPSALARAIDAALSGTGAGSPVLWLLLVGAADIAADLATGVLTLRLTATATARLRERLSAKLVELGTASRFASGDALSRLTGDCQGAGALGSVLVQLGSAVLVSAGAVTLLAVLDWRLALVFLASVPIALLIARSHLRLTADDVLAYQEVSGELSARLLDAIGGLRTIAAAGIADREAERVLRPLPKLGVSGIGMWRTQALMVWKAGLLLPSVELAVLTAAGFGVYAGRLSIGDVLAALGYVVLGMSLVRQIPLLTALAKARSCAGRLAEVLDEPKPWRGGLPLPCGRGELELRGVSVGNALREIDLRVPGGCTMAVVGRSGSGKSTLAEVAGALRTPDRGHLLLDGFPAESLAPQHLRAAIGYAFERPALLGPTVRDAVGYGNWAGTIAVRRACRAAAVHDLITRLPEGYQTPMDQTPLSGGEAQRIGLARAIARSPRVLVLDDATASLDTVTEAHVEHAISELLPRSTRIVVTHRAGTASRADLVAWLDNGDLRAVAPHHHLWQDPDYRAVFTGEGDASGLKPTHLPEASSLPSSDGVKDAFTPSEEVKDAFSPRGGGGG